MQLTDLTILIKTFERPACVTRLVSSIRRSYAEVPILVGDDGFTPCNPQEAQHIRLAPDIGVSAGRNHLLDRIETDFFLLLDDDFEFLPNTRIEDLLRIAREAQDVHLVAGAKRGPRDRLLSTPRVFLREGDTLYIKHGYHDDRGVFQICDFVPNFFVARTEAIQRLRWDESLKTFEHLEFFLRFQQKGWKAAYVPTVSVREWNDRPPGYGQWRNRVHFLYQGLRKHGIRKLVHSDGREVIVPPTQ